MVFKARSFGFLPILASAWATRRNLGSSKLFQLLDRLLGGGIAFGYGDADALVEPLQGGLHRQ